MVKGGDISGRYLRIKAATFALLALVVGCSACHALKGAELRTVSESKGNA